MAEGTPVTSPQDAGNPGGSAANDSSANANSNVNTRTDSGSSANAPLQTTNSQGIAPNSPTSTQKTGSLGNVANFDKAGSLDVVRNYPWTLSKLDRNDVPEIILHEHRNDESAIMRQLQFYASGAADVAGFNIDSLLGAVGGAAIGTLLPGLPGLGSTLGAITGYLAGVKKSTEGKKLLSVYEEIFPDYPTGNIYYFPYFTKSYMSLTSPQWEQLDDIGSSIDNIMQGAQDMLAGPIGAKGVAKGLDLVRRGASFAKETAMLGLKSTYPVVGIFDRPRIFASHNEREVTIDFPLYNTINPDDWKTNRDLIYLMMSQYLYLKNSFITGYPPVFYRVLVPGQYFSFASCVTDFSVTNLGNIRKLSGFNVPDAWQVSLTLKEMLMPSKNQFFAMTNGEAAGKINVSLQSGLAPGAR